MNIYSDYKPILSATKTNPTLGAGSVQIGRFMQDGLTVNGRLQINFGGKDAASGEGGYYISLPVDAREAEGNPVIGHGWIYGTNTRAMVNPHYTVKMVCLELDDNPTRAFMRSENIPQISSELPWHWGPGDAITLMFNYEAI